jgi:hypothetical protein
VNSEELELSLRTEFESYLKDVVAEMRRGVTEFQEKINADFEKHKEELDKSLAELNEKLSADKELDTSFTETVVEHLKLARDEGASVTASAIAEAEKLDEEAGPDFSDLRDAIADISSKDSKSEILKALVNHSSAFTPRGAFFIVKNEHLVGWRVFGREEHNDPNVVREVFFPVSTNTALGAAVEGLSTIMSEVEDSQDDVMYRNKLGFDSPEGMFAIPLIARGRGVAVLYADSGANNGSINLSALESLMKVAGLTVEVLASAPQVSKKKEVEEEKPEDSDSNEANFAAADSFNQPQVEEQPSESFEPVQEFTPETIESVEQTEFTPIADSISEYTSPETFEEEGTDEYSSVPGDESAEFEPVEEDVVYEGVAFDAGSDNEAAEPVAGYEAPSWEDPDAESESEPYSDASSDSFSPDVSFAGNYDTTEDTASSFDSYEEPAEDVYSDSDAEPEAVSYEFESTTAELADSEESDSTAYSFDSSEPYSVEEEVSETVETYSEVSETVETYSFDQPIEAPVSDFTEQEPTADFAESEPDSDEHPAQFRDQPVEVSDFTEEAEVPVEVEAEPVDHAQPVRSRFADRNLDLPIEVDEKERRLHNDARRFARLLVSEIKLYNEQKVKEGRESCDLYERLREAIDRSREMYDKRVQPPVAQKFDYFNYELVNTLAEGDDARYGLENRSPACWKLQAGFFCAACRNSEAVISHKLI